MFNNTYKLRLLTAADRYKIWLPLLILVGSITFGFFMITFYLFLPNIYATILTVAMMVPLAILITGAPKRVLLAILVICLPIKLSFTLGLTVHHSGSMGFIISAFDIALAALYLFWLFEIFGKKDVRVNFFPQVSIPAFFLILIAALSMAFARFPYLSLVEIIEVLKMYLCFLYLANNIRDRSDVKLIVFFLLLGLLFEGILGLAQHRYSEPFWPNKLGGPKYIGSRITGTWMSSNDFAWYLALLLPIALSILFSEIRVAYKFLLGFTFLLSSGSMIWTSSRGGWISLAVGALFVCICAFSKIKGKPGLLKIFGWIMVVAIFVSPLYPRLLNKFYVRATRGDRGAAAARIEQFKVAYNIIKDNLFIGVGTNNYTEVMYGYDTTEEGLDSYSRQAVHNIFLHIAAEMGVFGLAAFMSLICAIFVVGMKHIISRDDFTGYVVIGMVGGIITFLIHGLVDTASIGNKLYMFVWFFAGVIFSAPNIKSTEGAHL